MGVIKFIPAIALGLLLGAAVAGYDFKSLPPPKQTACAAIVLVDNEGLLELQDITCREL